MNNLENLIRPNILKLKPYSSARDEWKGNEGVFLDANENPYGNLNRYPDPYQKALKSKISKIKNIPDDQIFIGNGSDEVIDLLLRIFCEPSKDQIIICPPTYGMYEVSANINNVNVIEIPLDADFQLQTALILKQKAKIIFLCSPNNPTGNTLVALDIILNNFDGIVVIDEAYIDFSTVKSYANRLDEFPNLVVMQTLSKAYGLAAARIGMAFSNEIIIGFLNKVKPPYNVSFLNQDAALERLENQASFEIQKQQILESKIQLQTVLLSLSFVKKIFPSEANFLLVEVIDANRVYEFLVHRKIIIRNRNSVVRNCIRISIGTEAENKILMEALKNFENEMNFKSELLR